MMTAETLTSFSPDIFKNVPQELANRQRWLLWSAEPQEGKNKPKKVPRYADTYSRRSGELGGKKDVSQLVTLAECLEAQARHPEAGIGFAFVDGDNLVGIDLDNCIDQGTGELSEKAQKLMNATRSYTEYSPSGTGIHIIVGGSTYSAKCTVVEVYPSGRFFCFTGRALEDMPCAVTEKDERYFAALHRTIELQKNSEQKAKDAERSARLKAATTQDPARSQTTYSKDDQAFADKLLGFIPASLSNDEWVTVGMGLKQKFGEEGFAIWDAWSRTSQDKYPGEREMSTRWRSFKRDGVSFGSVVHLAKQYGFEPQARRETEQARYEDQHCPAHGDPEENPQEAPAPSQANPVPRKTANPSDWPDPMDILTIATPPQFPVHLMPGCTGDFIQDQSEIIGCDMASVGAGVIVSLAAAIDDRQKIKPTRHKRWKEEARIWCAFVGEPSEKKTPGMSAALRPVRAMDAKRAEQYMGQLATYKLEMKLYQQSLRKKGEPLPEPTEPPDNRIMVGSATIEALQKILTHTKRGVLVTRDELSGWFGSMDAYSGGGKGGSKDRSAWLELYNGGAQRIDTINRGSLWIENWSACLLGAIQPDAIRKITKHLPEDGLMQRFIVLCASGGSSVGNDRPECPGLYDEYSTLVKTLYDKTYSDEAVVLSDGALSVSNSFFEWARAIIRGGYINGGLKGYVGKFEGLYSRLLLIWHMAETAGEEYINITVSEDTARRVADFVKDYLFPHAVYFYRNILAASDQDEDAKSVAQRVLVHDQEVITNRQLARTVHRWAGMTELERGKVMDFLTVSGWVDPIPDPKMWNKVTQWRINPKLKEFFQQIAERERKRIEESRRVLNRY